MQWLTNTIVDRFALVNRFKQLSSFPRMPRAVSSLCKGTTLEPHSEVNPKYIHKRLFTIFSYNYLVNNSVCFWSKIEFFCCFFKQICFKYLKRKCPLVFDDYFKRVKFTVHMFLKLKELGLKLSNFWNIHLFLCIIIYTADVFSSFGVIRCWIVFELHFLFNEWLVSL